MELKKEIILSSGDKPLKKYIMCKTRYITGSKHIKQSNRRGSEEVRKRRKKSILD